MNDLNPTNAFGELLLDLIEEQYGGDYDAGISALMETTGLSEEEVVSVIQGDTIIEDEGLLSGIIDAFPDADDEDKEVIVNVASGVDEADRADLIDMIDSDEAQDPGYQEEPDETMEQEPTAPEAEYAAYAVQQAQFAAQQAQEIQARWANFEAVNYLTAELRQLDNMATQAVSSNLLPPSYKALLIGNFAADDSSRISRFCQMAESNGVDVGTMLFATKYAMGLLTDASDFVEFNDYSVTAEDVAIASFSAGLDSAVKADLDAIFNN
jgi:hypothetical protein